MAAPIGRAHHVAGRPSRVRESCQRRPLPRDIVTAAAPICARGRGGAEAGAALSSAQQLLQLDVPGVTLPPWV